MFGGGDGMGLGDLFGFGMFAAGDLENAAREAAGEQLRAIAAERANLETQLNTGKVQGEALSADQAQAANRLAPQEKIDPGLAAARQSAEQNLSNIATNPNGNAESLANQLYNELKAPDAKTEQLK